MGKKAFSGDPTHKLPRGKREPYRLWFEYLKLALSYPGVQVDLDRYKSWGDVGASDFDAWWDENWRQLFATEPGTKRIATEAEAKEALNDPRFAVLRVSLTETKTMRQKGVNDALAGLRRITGHSNSDVEPAFVIVAKRAMNFRTLRGMLKYLQLYRDHKRDIEATSLGYYEWAIRWNDELKKKQLKLPRVYVPPFLAPLVGEIAERKQSVSSGRKRKNSNLYDTARNDAVRFVRRGEKILKNVGAGRFPGAF